MLGFRVFRDDARRDLVKSFKIHSNHLAYRETFCCSVFFNCMDLIAKIYNNKYKFWNYNFDYKLELFGTCVIDNYWTINLLFFSHVLYKIWCGIWWCVVQWCSSFLVHLSLWCVHDPIFGSKLHWPHYLFICANQSDCKMHVKHVVLS